MSLIKRPTKLELEGVGALTIRPGDYLTQGGEGAIYRTGDRVLKLALDQKKFAAAGYPDKIALLHKNLSHPSIVAPKGLIRNSKGVPVGFHLPFVEGEPYPRLFTNDWRNKQGFTDASVTQLTAAMHEVVAHAHQGGALMVDANELNWLADISDVQRPAPKIIDVDSWQIDRFKASVVMPSIRDWHGPIAETSDWFAWGVVSFLLYTGTHPYKGKLDGYKPGEMERRMKENASVFRPDIHLNKNVRDFSVIPGPLLDWYRATFEDGERSLPPSPLQTGVANTTLNRVMRAATTLTGGLVYEQLLRIPGEVITSVWPCGIVRTDTDTLVEISSKQVIGSVSGKRAAVVATDGGWLVAESVGTDWTFRFLKRGGLEHSLHLKLPVQNVLRNGERIFAITETELVELKLQMFSQPVLTTGSRWQILGNSTNWFQGVGISDVLGAMHLVVPNDEDAVSIVRIPELDGKRIVNSIAHGRIATVVTIDKTGQYEVYDFAGSDGWRSYSTQVRLCDGPGLNQAVLPKGVTADIREDGELIITVPTQGAQKIVQDKDLFTTMRLSNIGDLVVYRYEDALWSLRMQ